MAWYKTGTVTINNSTSVAGTGTAWVANVKAGDAFVVNGTVYEVGAVNSDNALTLTTTFSGSVTTGAYLIAPVQGYIKALAEQVNTLLTSFGGFYDSSNDTVSSKDVTLKNWSANPPGTVSSPALRRASTDTDTGIYWSADNELAVAAGGVKAAAFTPTGINATVVGATTPAAATVTTLATTGNATIGGNLVVNGTTTTVNATTTTLDDPVVTLGGDIAPTVDDNKDRGIEFRWHNGTSAKVGFFGFDDSTGKFTFVPDASNASEVFSGTAGPAAFGALSATTLDASGLITANGGAVLFDSNLSLKDNTDPTKIVTFDVGSQVSAATTRTFAFPDITGTLATAGTGTLNAPRNADLGSAAYSDLVNLVKTSIPTTVAAASVNVSSADTALIIDYAGTCTVTLPAAASYPGRTLTIKTLQAQLAVSAASDVAPIASATAGTEILAATAGKWVRMVSNGAAWVVMEAN